MTPKEIKLRVSMDPEMDSINDEMPPMRDEYLFAVMQEAEKIVLCDTLARVCEGTEVLTVDQRAFNLPSDFLVPIRFKWKEPTDDPLMEFPVNIALRRHRNCRHR